MPDGDSHRTPYLSSIPELPRVIIGVLWCRNMDYITEVSALDPSEPPDDTVLRRLAALKFCGVWHTPDGDYAVFDDGGVSGSSFLMQVGETLGECLQRLVERYEAVSPVDSMGPV